MNNSSHKTKNWQPWLDILSLILLIFSFTPLVIAESKIEPMLWGVPYNLWTGILMSVAFVALTWIRAVLSDNQS